MRGGRLLGACVRPLGRYIRLDCRRGDAPSASPDAGEDPSRLLTGVRTSSTLSTAGMLPPAGPCNCTWKPCPGEASAGSFMGRCWTTPHVTSSFARDAGARWQQSSRSPPRVRVHPALFCPQSSRGVPTVESHKSSLVRCLLLMAPPDMEASRNTRPQTAVAPSSPRPTSFPRPFAPSRLYKDAPASSSGACVYLSPRLVPPRPRRVPARRTASQAGPPLTLRSRFREVANCSCLPSTALLSTHRRTHDPLPPHPLRLL